MARGAKIVESIAGADEGNAANRQMDKSSPDDRLNRSIISLLQQDGRMAFSEVAQELGVSEGTIRNRVGSMKQAGMLRIVAMADPVAAEYKTDAMLGLKLASGHAPAAVAERLAALPDVVYILWVSGRFDLLVEVVSDDRNGFLDFLNREIHGQPDIASSETMTGLKNFKNQFLLKRNWE
ncbi:Lrp/AsnC family transcriptional regulator [Pelagibius sp. Alg239-R121]|uniref:Lrp/AsnC family transcriptional regulator n=1 Tax=Pelagibius sp. Alg239-R121 TaxID=2993448 RepID=UPI0024A6F94C|nr:Lrp/AsnC family transcriptional regulator [Pelagibius sp. Alg239-R121]